MYIENMCVVFQEIISEGSYLLMDIIGQHDIPTSSSFLALYQVMNKSCFSCGHIVAQYHSREYSCATYVVYQSYYVFQSCSMAQTLHSLVERIQTDSSLSRLAAIMKQREILARRFLRQETVSSVLATTTQALAEFEVI